MPRLVGALFPRRQCVRKLQPPKCEAGPNNGLARWAGARVTPGPIFDVKLIDTHRSVVRRLFLWGSEGEVRHCLRTRAAPFQPSGPRLLRCPTPAATGGFVAATWLLLAPTSGLFPRRVRPVSGPSPGDVQASGGQGVLLWQNRASDVFLRILEHPCTYLAATCFWRPPGAGNVRH